jgi:hypothetical protein
MSFELGHVICNAAATHVIIFSTGYEKCFLLAFPWAKELYPQEKRNSGNTSMSRLALAEANEF